MNLPNLRTYLLAGLLIAAHTKAQTPLITVDTVPVEHPGNGNDNASGYGSVGYPYRIGKYEVTIEQYAVFLNSVARTNTNSDIVNLWNSRRKNFCGLHAIRDLCRITFVFVAAYFVPKTPNL